MPAVALKYALACQPYTATGANYQADYPPQNLANMDAPSLLARSDDTTDGVVVLDLGTGMGIAAFSVEGQNFGLLTIEHSDTGVGGWSSVGSFDVSATRGIGGRRIAVCVPNPACTKRYIQLTPGTPDAGAAVYEWGIVAAWPTLVTMSAILGVPYRRRVDDKTESVELGGGQIEFGRQGASFVQITTQGHAYDDEPTQQEEYRALARIPRGRVFLWWESDYGVTAAYHVRRTGAVEFTIDGATLETVTGFQVTEVVS